MIKPLLRVLIFVGVLACVLGNTNQLCINTPESWGYVEVRENAHMFWWAYCTTSSSPKPLILWLQGGPGGSSTGFGNFGEIGPLDTNLKPRNTTWLGDASLLFIDNPVGTGFSYATTDDAFTTNVGQIAQDLLVVLKAYMAQNQHFQDVPFFIFSESYGGKMTAAFSKVLYKAIHDGGIKCNFKGLAMGDSWISPMDSVLTWGPYLYATSLVDAQGLSDINKSAMKTNDAVIAGNFTVATDLWQKTEDIILNVTHGVSFYNILDWNNDDKELKNSDKEWKNGDKEWKNDDKEWKKKKRSNTIDKLYRTHVSVLQSDDLSSLMNGPIRKKLGIIPKNVTWGGQSGKVFQKQAGDFMKPVIDIVDELLLTNLKVVVYSGQLDLIVDTMGTEKWVQRLSWSGLSKYNSAKRTAITDREGRVQAFVKQNKNFSFYWILDAGHMVPADNGCAALEMLKRILTE